MKIFLHPKFCLLHYVAEDVFQFLNILFLDASLFVDFNYII